MANPGEAIEQLWYTWSDVGLDSISAGFRIRAASKNLQDVRSERVQNLDRYLRYVLPRDVDVFSVTPETAPICLCLITTGQERILVHKAYTGKDGVGRRGAFFVHLLCGLPEDFSAADAISLWRSGFFKMSDKSLGRRDTTLESIAVQTLKRRSTDVFSSLRHSDTISKYLPYIIQAYLLKKSEQKLYIAASDDDIATLIFGLTQCLPRQLLKNLTFSTYERDVTRATTEIVGTCWLSVPGAEKNPLVQQLFPSQYYQEQLAINCYLGSPIDFANNQLVKLRPFADDFAKNATILFVKGGSRKFTTFLEKAEGEADLDADKFLALYDKPKPLRVGAQKTTKEKIAKDKSSKEKPEPEAVPTSTDELSPIQRLKLWWERMVAYVYLWLALTSKHREWIESVELDYMTTLSSYDEEMPEKWWKQKIDNAYKRYENYKEQHTPKKATSSSEAKTVSEQLAQVKSPVIHPQSVLKGRGVKRRRAREIGHRIKSVRVWWSNKALPGMRRMKEWWTNKLAPRIERFWDWWEPRVAFMQMRDALRSKQIGKIVRVEREWQDILEKNSQKLPEHERSWRQIAVARSYFNAYKEEEALVSAINEIENLAKAEHPVPRFTEHEKRRNLAVKRSALHKE